MKLLFILAALVVSLRYSDGFHVDPSPEHARKTYLVRKQEPAQIRQEEAAPAAYTDNDRAWRFPDSSRVRPIGDTTLTSLTDEDRLHGPAPNMIRTAPSTGKFEDRLWRKPKEEMVRHTMTNSLPPLLKDEERFWWKDDKFDHLLLEPDDEFSGTSVKVTTQGKHKVFQRPTAKFSRHPHSQSEFDGEVISTMVEDDSLGWLTQNTNNLLMNEEAPGVDGTIESL